MFGRSSHGASKNSGGGAGAFTTHLFPRRLLAKPTSATRTPAQNSVVASSSDDPAPGVKLVAAVRSPSSAGGGQPSRLGFSVAVVRGRPVSMSEDLVCDQRRPCSNSVVDNRRLDNDVDGDSDVPDRVQSTSAAMNDLQMMKDAGKYARSMC